VPDAPAPIAQASETALLATFWRLAQALVEFALAIGQFACLFAFALDEVALVALRATFATRLCGDDARIIIVVVVMFSVLPDATRPALLGGCHNAITPLTIVLHGVTILLDLVRDVIAEVKPRLVHHEVLPELMRGHLVDVHRPFNRIGDPLASLLEVGLRILLPLLQVHPWVHVSELWLHQFSHEGG
jgi:hypothetical protein